MREIALKAKGARALVDAGDGGRLASLVVGGAERLVTKTAGEERGSTMWGCFPMAPWCGRLANGELWWNGETLKMPANLGPHAIHGLLFGAEWEVAERAVDRTSMVRPLDHPSWTPGGIARQSWRLWPDRLEATGELVAGDHGMPAAWGWHPWFARPQEGDLLVRIEAARVLETLDDLIPTGRILAAKGDADLRSGPPLGARRLDHVYVDASSPAVVTWPDLALSIEFEPPLGTVVVFSPPGAVCVEPQSAWPDAFRLERAGAGGTGARRLRAGESLFARMTMRWRLVV